MWILEISKANIASCGWKHFRAIKSKEFHFIKECGRDRILLFTLRIPYNKEHPGIMMKSELFSVLNMSCDRKNVSRLFCSTL